MLSNQERSAGTSLYCTSGWFNGGHIEGNRPSHATNDSLHPLIKFKK